MLLGYVLLVGNPWVNRDIDLVLSSSDSALRLVDVLVRYPSWQLDVDRFGPFLFWLANLRTVLFVGLAMAGLARVSRWLRVTTGGAGVFVAIVGAIALSAVAAGLTAAAIVQILLDGPFPFISGDDVTEFFSGPAEHIGFVRCVVRSGAGRRCGRATPQSLGCGPPGATSGQTPSQRTEIILVKGIDGTSGEAAVTFLA